MPLLRGERIKEHRKRIGLTQKELSLRCNMSLRQLQRVEAGESDVTGDTLIKIARELGVSMDYLAGLVAAPTNHVANIDPDMERFMVRFRNLPQDSRDLILRFVFGK